MDRSKRIAGILFAVVVVGVAALAILNSATFSVQYGQVSILTRFGKIVGEPKEPGLHFKIPVVDEVVTYRTQKIVYETLSFTPYTGASNSDYQDFAVDTNTKDGQQVSIRYTVRFSIDPDKIKDVANTLGTEEEVVEKIVKTDSRIWARQIARNYSAADLYTGNVDEVSQEIFDKLAPIFEDNGLISRRVWYQITPIH
ncbi:MAG: SPFH domain-containing protein [Candidatus Dojkabacteria bacterium]|nr:MAG: SPFH domain-containing protein [Candidatus Dojkabacteria bacterium]